MGLGTTLRSLIRRNKDQFLMVKTARHDDQYTVVESVKAPTSHGDFPLPHFGHATLLPEAPVVYEPDHIVSKANGHHRLVGIFQVILEKLAAIEKTATLHLAGSDNGSAAPFTPRESTTSSLRTSVKKLFRQSPTHNSLDHMEIADEAETHINSQFSEVDWIVPQYRKPRPTYRRPIQHFHEQSHLSDLRDQINGPGKSFTFPRNGCTY